MRKIHAFIVAFCTIAMIFTDSLIFLPIALMAIALFIAEES